MSCTGLHYRLFREGGVYKWYPTGANSAALLFFPSVLPWQSVYSRVSTWTRPLSRVQHHPLHLLLLLRPSLSFFSPYLFHLLWVVPYLEETRLDSPPSIFLQSSLLSISLFPTLILFHTSKWKCRYLNPAENTKSNEQLWNEQPRQSTGSKLTYLKSLTSGLAIRCQNTSRDFFLIKK